MKIAKILGMASLMVVTTSSCKDFLETDSPSTFSQEYIFGTEADASKSVYSIYALFNQDAFTSRLSNNFTGNSDIEVGGVSAAPDNSRRDIWSFETTDANGDLRTVWNNAYSAINRANLCVEGIQQSAIASNSEMKQLLGEAKALRALWYYWLINHWGDVPFSMKPTRGGDDFYQPRVGRDTILTELINDLISIEPEMKPSTQITYGIERVNREFVMGLIARLALTRGGYWLYPDMTMRRKDDYLDYYKIARDYCQKLISTYDRPLNPNFRQIFDNESKWIVANNDDVLFEVAFQKGFGDVGWCHGIRVDAGSHPYGSGSNYLGMTPTYYHSFDTLDKRLDVTCSIIYYNSELQQTPTAVTAIAPGKWNRILMGEPAGSQSAKGTGINWPIMRYSDVLLMLAESANELGDGPTEDAKQALRRVRQRAFDSSLWTTKVENYINSVSGSKDAFFKAIVDERAWEFGGECIRKYDLIRWNLYGKKVAETRAKLNQMGADANGGVGQYADLPDVLYYRLNSDKSVTFYNKFKRANSIPPLKDSPSKGDNPNGFTRMNWLKGLYNTTTSGPADYNLRTWRGYQDDSGVLPVRYILPLHASTVSSSRGVLNNNGYGY
ncbi:RagB/SusD domain protein [Pseudopedobacter saltans DSM 12145]|uniref:RagB/SusD domain protein n=1 Tax=Pseudopedobacter saltans (strain ATCC 51119 / DSM 12145 / JCM 21818 / CCUG 39354 / LMG 10337 / NBRC 100064 / NCIMB 13643) TaxID=762903 RepID=F0S5X0_PSESL|nr:RagB/SusD family nutrient uptake outer membrane protein [Pseudopedobacter saltans]ADY51041.1 RagB/SusD domain protein [Pseudopedobacter saltans DSM 12145]